MDKLYLPYFQPVGRNDIWIAQTVNHPNPNSFKLKIHKIPKGQELKFLQKQWIWNNI